MGRRWRPLLIVKPMTLDRARQLLKVQAEFGGFYNSNSAKLILSEVMKEHGQAAVDRLILELNLDAIFGFQPGTRFEGGLAHGREY
jgi:hypothetical protein